MTLYCMEMRSTQNWSDVRYRAYTTREDRAIKFKSVPRIPFTDSGHGIVPSVREVMRREPNIWILSEHVHPHLNVPEPAPRKSYRALVAERNELLEALKYVLSAHGEQLTDAFDMAHKAIAKAEGQS